MADVWHTFNTKVFWDVIPCSLAGGHSILCCDVVGPAACGYRTNLCNCCGNPKLNIRITKQKYVTNALPTCTVLLVLSWRLQEELMRNA